MRRSVPALALALLTACDGSAEPTSLFEQAVKITGDETAQCLEGLCVLRTDLSPRELREQLKLPVWDATGGMWQAERDGWIIRMDSLLDDGLWAVYMTPPAGTLEANPELTLIRQYLTELHGQKPDLHTDSNGYLRFNGGEIVYAFTNADQISLSAAPEFYREDPRVLKGLAGIWTKKYCSVDDSGVAAQKIGALLDRTEWQKVRLGTCTIQTAVAEDGGVVGFERK